MTILPDGGSKGVKATSFSIPGPMSDGFPERQGFKALKARDDMRSRSLLHSDAEIEFAVGNLITAG